MVETGWTIGCCVTSGTTCCAALHSGPMLCRVIGASAGSVVDGMPGPKQILVHLTEQAAAAMDKAAKERGMTRSNFVEYVMTAFGAGTVLMSDPTTWKAWTDYQNELLEHTARVIARQETRLVLEEEGFTTSRFTL